MHESKLVVDPPVVIDDISLVAVSRVSAGCWHIGHGLSLFGSKVPVFIVTRSRMGEKAFRITGEEISREELLQEIPGINEQWQP